MNTPLKPQSTQPKGLLNERTSLQHFDLNLYAAPAGLETIVDTVWHVTWDLPTSTTHQQSNLAHPTMHIVLDALRGSGLYGCSTEVFEYEIIGKGQVIGFKLHPGMGRCFYDGKLTDLTNTYIPLDSMIGGAAEALEAQLNRSISTASIIENFAREVSKISRPKNEKMKAARKAVHIIEKEPALFRVDKLCSILSTTPRQLQRLFSEFVGVSPKWAINRYRILDAVSVLNSGSSVDLSGLAYDLGYSDQAHFSKDFKTITGESPAAYLNKQQV